MKGQALVESLIVYCLIFLTTFCVIEIARLQAFKTLLQISLNYHAKYLSLNEMELIRKYHFNLDSNGIFKSKGIEYKLKKMISDDLALMGTSLFAFDEKTKKFHQHNVLINIELLAKQNAQSPPGIHIKAQTCLPVLFSGLLNSVFKGHANIGRSVNDQTYRRNCLGEFIDNSSNSKNKSQIFWFRVRAAAYSPWPSSTQIFYKGFTIPDNTRLIEKKYYKKFLERLNQVNLVNIFAKTEQYSVSDQYEKE